jgi:class 3 adenylate cyclase
MPQRDLTGFVPLPHNPAYLVHPDGRVVSLKKQMPTVLSEHRAVSPVWWRVRIGRYDIRVRDLVLVMFGDPSKFEDRAWQWVEDNIEPRES